MPGACQVTQPVKHGAGNKASTPPQPLPRLPGTTGSPCPRRHSLHLQGQAEVQRRAAADGDVVGEVSRPERAKLAPQQGLPALPPASHQLLSPQSTVEPFRGLEREVPPRGEQDPNTWSVWAHVTRGNLSWGRGGGREVAKPTCRHPLRSSTGT